MLSHLQLDSQYEKQRQRNREQEAIFFCISKHRIRLRICSLPHSIQRYCHCILIVHAYTLPPNAQAGQVACAISTELPPVGRRVVLLKETKKRCSLHISQAASSEFLFHPFERLWELARFLNIKHCGGSNQSVLSTCNDYFFRITYIIKDTKIYILTKIQYVFSKIILVSIPHTHSWVRENIANATSESSQSVGVSE